ncbi:MAG: hypothetical protein HW416_3275 [Chloroflexi bacterium]|nr:hypothetical protein [Chloroflexota bacterium]
MGGTRVKLRVSGLSPLWFRRSGRAGACPPPRICPGVTLSDTPIPLTLLLKGRADNNSRPLDVGGLGWGWLARTAQWIEGDAHAI